MSIVSLRPERSDDEPRALVEMARVVINQRSRPPLSSNELLKRLHWLPLEWRIQFKLAILTFKVLHNGRPQYLTDLLQHHQPTHILFSSAINSAT